MNRQFWMGIGVGLVAASLLQQRQKGSLTQERLDAYYHRRAGNYNATDNLYLLGRYPRIEMREAVMDLAALKPGDKVLDFACGAGANFPYIMERIGPTGKLVGVDYSGDMLKEAQGVIDRGGWENVELIESDAATMQPGENFDVVLCTLGLVVIPRYEMAMQAGWDALKPGGTYAVADLCESERWYGKLLGFAMNLMDLLIVIDTTRRPWEWLSARAQNFYREDLFYGFFYVASGKKPA